jgi:hypothetical protein
MERKRSTYRGRGEIGGSVSALSAGANTTTIEIQYTRVTPDREN